MRLYFLVLLCITGSGAGIVNAGTLVGDWYLEEVHNNSTGERRAITQPVIRSLGANQVTLGIETRNSTEAIKFFALLSSDPVSSGCEYRAYKVTIDSETFPVNSSAYSSNAFQISSPRDDIQQRLWRLFRKGQNLTLNIQQTCNNQNSSTTAVTTYVFSLHGSNAAYQFVSGDKVTAEPAPPVAGNGKPVNSSEPESIAPGSVDESDYTPLLTLLAVGILAVMIARVVTRGVKPTLQNAGPAPVRKSPDPGLTETTDVIQASGASRKEPELTRETRGTRESETELHIASLPRYKVERVIDGDTVIVSTLWQSLTIRLSSIDCPEDGQEWGNIATAGLIKIIGGQHVHVEQHGLDHYDRTLATLYLFDGNSSKWTNVNERMVTLGHAWVMRKYYGHLPKYRQAQLNALERWAKSKRVGLWKLPDPVPPWNWRQSSEPNKNRG